MVRRVFVVMVGVLAVGVLGAGSAFGALSYPFDGQLAPAGGAFGGLRVDSVAVDDLSGDAYVAESIPGAVYVFDSSGAQLASLDGALTPAGSFGTGQTAVAANNGTGEVYVLDEQDSVVDVFDPAGGYVCQITGSSTPSASECNGVSGSATPAGALNHPEGIAVDQATGEVYVLDQRNEVVDVFSAGGAYLRQVSLAPIPNGNGLFARGIAVSGFNGHLYVAGYPATVYEFDGSGVYVTAWKGANTPAGRFEGEVSVAADDTSGEVYITGTGNKLTYAFGSSGEYLAQFSHSFSYPRGTTVDQASHRVYVANQESVVDILGPAVVVPDVTTGAAGEIGPNSATLHGSVNPDGIQLSDCHFEYGTDTSYGQSAPCAPAAGAIPADSSEHPVSATLTGLVAGTTYHFRLVAANANGPNMGADATFSTPPPPSVESATALSVSGSSADLTVKINPNGYDTTYRFEYGTSTAYGTSVPVPDADLGAGTGAVPVSTHLSGLAKNTTYHWRVVAQNVNGTTTTRDHTIVYSTAGAGLPDNRAYEMVTPPQKNGALIGKSVLGVPADVSLDGSRVLLTSIQCFAGSGSCVGDRYGQGEPFLFSRTAGGWVTTAMAPSARQLGYDSESLASADAGTVLFSIETSPGGPDDWYARESGGSFVDIGPGLPPGANGILAAANYRAATADLSHIVWVNKNPDRMFYWPFDSTLPGEYSVYEYVGSGGRVPLLVGVSGSRGSTDLISDCGTNFAPGNENGGGLSSDGRTVFFTAYVCSSGSGVNAGVPVPSNEVWARIDESRSVLLSGRSPAGCTSVQCLGSPAGDAYFEGASADGSRAFFASTQQLTNAASEDSHSGDTAWSASGCEEAVGVNGCNLYEYDFARGAQDNPVAVSVGDSSGGGPRVQGVMVVSSDGSHTYFVAKGVLSNVANSEGQLARDGADNLYLFEHDARYPTGHVAFIAALPQADRERWNGSDLWVNVTPDGRFLVFTSHGALTADDSSVSSAAQVFRYDAQTGVLIRVSIGDGGFNDNGNGAGGAPCTTYTTDVCPLDASIAIPQIRHAGAARLDPTMSDDGSYVFFLSPVALTPDAVDETQIATRGSSGYSGQPVFAENVYEYHDGQVSLISDGKDLGEYGNASDVTLIGSDMTGMNVFFTTSDPLVAQDGDTELDVYDARMCSASSPCIASPASVASCQGEACHGTPPAAAGASGPGSSTFTGPGNLAPPVVAARKTVAKKHVKHKQRKRPKRKHAKRSSARGARRNKGVRS